MLPAGTINVAIDVSFNGFLDHKLHFIAIIIQLTMSSGKLTHTQLETMHVLEKLIHGQSDLKCSHLVALSWVQCEQSVLGV